MHEFGHRTRGRRWRPVAIPIQPYAGYACVHFAEVWCRGCNARFTVRHTTGDPGFVVDLSFRYVAPRVSRYLLPRSESLVLTLVCKNSADPLELSYADYCGRIVAAADLERTVKAKRPWQTPHGACRETWQAGDWTPTLFGSA